VPSFFEYSVVMLQFNKYGFSFFFKFMSPISNYASVKKFVTIHSLSTRKMNCCICKPIVISQCNDYHHAIICQGTGDGKIKDNHL